MTVATETAYAERAWTGVETSFNPSMQAASVADVLLSYRNASGQVTALTNGVNLNLALDGSKNVTATVIALPAAPGTVIFRRRTSAAQGVDFANLGEYSPNVHTALADNAAFRDAELRQDVGDLNLRIDNVAAAASGGHLTRHLIDLSGTTEVDPGLGRIRFNNATPANATEIYIDTADVNGASIAPFLDDLPARGRIKADLRIGAPETNTWLSFTVASIASVGGLYYKLKVKGTGSFPNTSPFANAAPAVAVWSRVGDEGFPPPNTFYGVVDLSSNAPAGIAAGEVRFNAANLSTVTHIYISDTDADGAGTAGQLTGLDTVANPVKADLEIALRDHSNVWHKFAVADIVFSAGVFDLTVQSNGGFPSNAPFVDADAVALVFDRAGNKGADGINGTNGINGVDGGITSRHTLDLAELSANNPGFGKIRFNASPPGAATKLYVNSVDANGTALLPTVNSFIANLNGIKADIQIARPGVSNAWLRFEVRNIDIDDIGGAFVFDVVNNGASPNLGPFVDAEIATLSWVRAGDAGDGTAEALQYRNEAQQFRNQAEAIANTSGADLQARIDIAADTITANLTGAAAAAASSADGATLAALQASKFASDAAAAAGDASTNAATAITAQNSVAGLLGYAGSVLRQVRRLNAEAQATLFRTASAGALVSSERRRARSAADRAEGARINTQANAAAAASASLRARVAAGQLAAALQTVTAMSATAMTAARVAKRAQAAASASAATLTDDQLQLRMLWFN